MTQQPFPVHESCMGNGALRLLPGSQRPARLRFRRAASSAAVSVLIVPPGASTGGFGATVSESDLESERHATDPPLRTREELAYYRIFVERLLGVDARKTLGRSASVHSTRAFERIATRSPGLTSSAMSPLASRRARSATCA